VTNICLVELLIALKAGRLDILGTISASDVDKALDDFKKEIVRDTIKAVKRWDSTRA
jgi:hypothetical protein